MRRSDLRRDMIAFDLPRLLLVTLLTVALTSSVSARPDDLDIHDKPVTPRNPNSLKFEQKYQIIRTARSSKSSEHRTESAQNSTKQDFSIGSNSTTIVNSSDAIDDEKATKWAEGGPISIIFSTTQHENMIIESAASIESDKLNESRTRENVHKERFADPNIVARKGAELKKEPKKGIQARKGVDPDSLNHATFNATKSMETVNGSVTEAAHISNQTETSNISISKLDANSSRSSYNLDHNIKSNYSSTSLAPANVTTSPAKTTVIHNATTTPKTSLHVPKPKPTVTTVDGPEVNESRPSSRTKSSSLRIPRKIDYIAPVIITIIALPILGAAIFMLYRRGRDCWDKRHYRRMDFLIDGMYND